MAKMRLVYGLMLCICLFGVASAEDGPSPANQADQIPMEAFFERPEKLRFSISPDGRYLAWMSPWKDRLNVFVQPAEGGAVLQVTHAEDQDIGAYGWASATRLVYLLDGHGDENYGLYAVNPDGSEDGPIAAEKGVKTRIVDVLKDDDVHMLISNNKRNPGIFDVFRLNILTGEKVLVAENPGYITGWMTDHDGRLRGAFATDGLEQILLYRESESSEFREVSRINHRDTLAPIAFDYDNRHWLVASDLGRDNTAIYRFDPGQNRFGALVFEKPGVDVQALMLSDRRKAVLGTVYETDRLHYEYFDDDARAVHDWLESALGDVEISGVSESRDENIRILRTWSDRDRGAYYLADVAARTLRPLADIRGRLRPELMAPMQVVHIPARDGIRLLGYLTLPPGARKPLPVILNPHGGPFGVRDSWGFSSETQFLASRGWGVLQVNFRGSGGFGKAFEEAGFKGWGKGVMQQDLTDAARWLVDAGIAPADKVAIYGGSYGGYATLAGLAFTPDLYACGVDMVGPSNLFTLLESFPPYWKPYMEMQYEKIGHPEKDRALLRSVSPFFHAGEIRAPLLIAQGANDPRVPQKESDQMVAALREKGIPVTYMLREDEGHGFAKQENQFAFYRAMEKFFRGCLGSDEAEARE
jgi:dipeptidyl aminopeptidase/acylaminoacyl peptidase